MLSTWLSLSLEKVTDRNQFGTISGVVTNFDNPYLTIDNANKYEISDFLNNNADWNSIKINDYANLTYCTDIDGIQYIIGLEINGNQLLSVDDGIERFKDATTIIIIVFAVLLALFIIATIVMFILYFKNKDKKTKKSIISN